MHVRFYAGIALCDFSSLLTLRPGELTLHVRRVSAGAGEARHARPMQECRLCCWSARVAATPDLESGELQRPPERVAQRPGKRPATLHSTEIRAGLLSRLTAGEEGDPRHGGRHGAQQHRERAFCDVFWVG